MNQISLKAIGLLDELDGALTSRLSGCKLALEHGRKEDGATIVERAERLLEILSAVHALRNHLLEDVKTSRYA